MKSLVFDSYCLAWLYSLGNFYTFLDAFNSRYGFFCSQNSIDDRNMEVGKSVGSHSSEDRTFSDLHFKEQITSKMPFSCQFYGHSITDTLRNFHSFTNSFLLKPLSLARATQMFNFRSFSFARFTRSLHDGHTFSEILRAWSTARSAFFWFSSGSALFSIADRVHTFVIEFDDLHKRGNTLVAPLTLYSKLSTIFIVMGNYQTINWNV